MLIFREREVNIQILFDFSTMMPFECHDLQAKWKIKRRLYHDILA